MAAEVSALIGAKLGVGGDGLEARIARAGRRLPARIRARATEIAEAAAMAQDPRLAHKIDPDRLRRAYREVTAHLGRIDPARRRTGALLSVLASIALGLILMFALWVAVLVWRGDL
jgi:hypothetical protein